MTILGYKYLVEADAQKARKDCSDYYGIPVSPEDTTQYWVDYQCAILDEPTFWYIIHLMKAFCLYLASQPNLM
jgi:hypothetical protein